MREDIEPDQVRRLGPEERFSFGCEPGVSCFNNCCRELELALTPYDVARLWKKLATSSSDFLDRYCLVEEGEGSCFPRVFLGMVDDGRASCPFVSPTGCQVYADRPGACRMYPLGRAAFTSGDGQHQEYHLLLTEPHCRGFSGTTAQNIDLWTLSQGLTAYNAANDGLMNLMLHPQGQLETLSPAQAETFVNVLYRLDEFRALVLAADFRSHTLPTDEERLTLADDDAVLIRFAGRWLRHELFDK